MTSRYRWFFRYQLSEPSFDARLKFEVEGFSFWSHLEGARAPHVDIAPSLSQHSNINARNASVCSSWEVDDDNHETSMFVFLVVGLSTEGDRARRHTVVRSIPRIDRRSSEIPAETPSPWPPNRATRLVTLRSIRPRQPRPVRSKRRW